MPKHAPLMFTISGPSCAGKTTLMSNLLHQSDVFSPLLSDTTRPIRAVDGEMEDAEYRFITEEEFDHKLESDLYCQAIEFNGHRYGITNEMINVILAQSKVPIRILEPTGVAHFKKVFKERWGGDVFSIYVDGMPYALLQRWLKRMYGEAQSSGEEPNFEYYTMRIMQAMSDETEWMTEYSELWDCYFNAETGDEPTMHYALARIAKGGLNMARARRLFPLPITKED